ncbi:MAG TPA: serine hydrolase domain-containing protein [Acidimicrobiales bacterium]|jgi:CubicO group peptidase (beta-lactamase class C family)|nr:serine hydrolase domain-containing protein [Acidimicrobiales bacterium]
MTTEARSLPPSVDPKQVDALLTRVQREIDDGLLPACQVAIAVDGEVVVDETFGVEPPTRFVPFSATKVLTAAATWRLIGDGALDVGRTVASYVPAFATNGKEVVTVEQVLLHTGGFPMAPLGPNKWGTRESRLEAFGRWRLTLTPGETYVYHPTAAHWVLAEIIETLTGEPYTDAIQHLVSGPLGLPRLLGIPLDQQTGIADAVGVGAQPTPAEMEQEFGIAIDLAQFIPPDVALAALLTLNSPSAREVGVPGGGGVMRAADLAMVYQGLLHNPCDLWDAAVLADATGHVRNNLPDWLGVPANRSLGLVIAGDDGRATERGFSEAASPRAFGHNGAGGQLAFADPDTGISAVYLTNGLDQHLIRERRRNADIGAHLARVAAATC